MLFSKYCVSVIIRIGAMSSLFNFLSLCVLPSLIVLNLILININ